MHPKLLQSMVLHSMQTLPQELPFSFTIPVYHVLIIQVTLIVGIWDFALCLLLNLFTVQIFIQACNTYSIKSFMHN